MNKFTEGELWSMPYNRVAEILENEGYQTEGYSKADLIYFYLTKNRRDYTANFPVAAFTTHHHHHNNSRYGSANRAPRSPRGHIKEIDYTQIYDRRELNAMIIDTIRKLMDVQHISKKGLRTKNELIDQYLKHRLVI